MIDYNDGDDKLIFLLMGVGVLFASAMGLGIVFGFIALIEGVM